MIEGAKWRTWVFFYLPMAFFLLFLLFPFYWMIITSFRPDGELYRPWNSVNYNPFWTRKPTLEHVRYLFEETLFSAWLWNTMFIALVSTAISLVCGVFAGYALSRLNFPFAGSLGTGIFITYLVPQTLLFIPLAEIIRNYKLGDTPWSLILTYPTFLIPVLHLADDGLLQGGAEGARGMRPHRRRLALAGDALHHHPGRHSRHSVGRHLRLHPVLERVHLCPGLPVLAGPKDGAGRRDVRADPRRCVLLGTADGGSVAGLDPGGRSPIPSSWSTTYLG